MASILKFGYWVCLLAVFLPTSCGRKEADPLAAARQFYVEHYDFYQLEDVEAVRDAVTPALYDLLKRMRREMDAGINVVEVDFWTFGQDGWIKGEPEYTVVHNDGHTAVVRLDYDFELNEIEKKHSALTLERDARTGRWFVSDLEGAEGYSFVAIFGKDIQGEADGNSASEGDESAFSDFGCRIRPGSVNGNPDIPAVPTTSPSQSPQDWPIDGTLDLHLFQPKEVGGLLPEYLVECRKRGILQVRIVHGKGTGQLRERVHAVLRRLPGVAAFGLAPEGMGGWGATVVELKLR